MAGLEQLLGFFVAAVILAAAARRVGAPYPVFLALGGALLAFLPGARPFIPRNPCKLVVSTVESAHCGEKIVASLAPK